MVKMRKFMSFAAILLSCGLATTRGFAKDKNQSSLGMTVEGTVGGLSENDRENETKIESIAAKIAMIESKTLQVRARILQLQSDSAARLQDTGNWEMILTVKSPDKVDLATKTVPISVQEISVDLNGYPILMQHSPIRIAKDQIIPLFSGPIPAGEYEVTLRAQVGLIPWEWPAAVTTGKWNIERTFKVTVAHNKNKSVAKSEIVLSAIEKNRQPVLSLNGVELN